MQVLRFHECPECGRLSPYLQSRCDCGYRFAGSEAQYKTCPECGSIIPSGQIVCDCGHVTLPRVRKSAPSSPAIPSFEAHDPADHAVSPGRPATPASEKKIENYRVAQPHSQDPLAEAEEVLKQRVLQQTRGKVYGPVARQTPRPLKKEKGRNLFSARDFGILTAMFALFAVIIVVGIIGHDNAVSSKSDTPTLSESDTALTPVPVRNGEIVEPPRAYTYAPLSVQASSFENYYVILSPLDGDPAKRMGFYVESGKIAEVSVPLSTFEIYYATGETWYGPDELFGEETRRYQCEGTFEFYDDGEYYQGWTLELFLQDNGNMDYELIGADEWPA